MSRSALEKSAQRKTLALSTQPQQPSSAYAYTHSVGVPQIPFHHQQLFTGAPGFAPGINAQAGINYFGGFPMDPNSINGSYLNMAANHDLTNQQYAPIKLSGDEDDIDDPASREKNTVPMNCNSSNYNINVLLHRNILESDYFKALYTLKTYHEVLNEIPVVVQHVEPWQTGTSRLPSSAFCLLLKLMLMKLTYKQMNGILNSQECEFIRAIGFLYLRYTCVPSDLWKWFEPFLEDDTDIFPCSDPQIRMSVGEYCIKLLTDMQYFGTTLPRIPVPIERSIRVRLLLLEEKKKRRRLNIAFAKKGQLSAGTKVRAIYSDADNEPAWYEAVIDMKDEESDMKYWVTFTEYGNQECVDLGDMEMKASDAATATATGTTTSDDRTTTISGAKDNHSSGIESSDNRDHNRRSRSNDRRDRDRDRDRRRDTTDSSRDRNRNRNRERDREKGSRDDRRDSRSRSRGRHNRDSHSPVREKDSARRDVERESSSQNLLERVLQSSRDASLAVGKNYGKRPTSYKGSLSLKLDRYTVREESPDRGDKSYRRKDERRRSRSRSGDRESSRASALTKVVSQEQLDRMKKLKERYGDASGQHH